MILYIFKVNKCTQIADTGFHYVAFITYYHILEQCAGFHFFNFWAERMQCKLSAGSVHP